MGFRNIYVFGGPRYVLDRLYGLLEDDYFFYPSGATLYGKYIGLHLMVQGVGVLRRVFLCGAIVRCLRVGAGAS